ncbi:type II toxin-antitoxin system VapC family toxin [Parasphingorhabdus flavimaris]|uniref:type II toxin-antitoxin system VapC family toxin n=1 Tax=Parasphingorhabdus flavimaris TaxID=266812 RepID=UPI00300387B6
MSEAVFDSNILIDALNDVGSAHAELKRYDRRYISRLTWVEVVTGALPDDGDRAEGFLSYFTIIEVNEEIGRRAALLRSDRKRLKMVDAIMLASAQLSGRILITRNTKDFPAAMPGIRIPYTL